MKIIGKLWVLFSLALVVLGANEKLPFVGKRFFYFGPKSVDSIEINTDGFTIIESDSGTKTSILYKGPYKKEIFISQDLSYFFEGNQICESLYQGEHSECTKMFNSKNELLGSRNINTPQKPSSGVVTMLKNAETDCKNGDGERCYYIGELYLHGADDLSPDPSNGWTFIKKGCILDNAKSCALYAQGWEEDVIMDKRSFSTNYQFTESERILHERIGYLFSASQYYKKACKLGDKHACSKHLEITKSIGADKLNENCVNGNMRDCFELGKYFIKKKVRAADQNNLLMAVDLFEKACFGGSMQACISNAAIYSYSYSSRLFPSNDEFNKAIITDLIYEYIGDHLIKDNKVRKKNFFVKSKEIAEKLCGQNNALACRYLAIYYRHGVISMMEDDYPDIPKSVLRSELRVNDEDRNQAKYYYRKACSLGDSNSCL